MRCRIYDDKTLQFIREEEREPQCGEDFCDSCGDCLDCYGDDLCPGTEDGEHRWVIYEQEAMT